MKNECSPKSLEGYRLFLKSHDMKPNTIAKYIRDVRKFLAFVQDSRLDHDAVAYYREYLLAHYKDTSTNSMLAALNSYLKYIGRKEECGVRLLKIQRQLFMDASRELTREEYERLVHQAESDGNQRLAHILQTIAGSGIRVGELAFITVESLSQQTVSINFKGKLRQILLPRSLVEKLENYCQMMGIVAGSIFVTRSGRPVDRRNVWREMKRLCQKAGVEESKAYPHNLRHLFARCFYEKEKDIVRLADYLGHSSVETTRRYTVTSQMEDCRKTLEMGLVLEADSMENEYDRLYQYQPEEICASYGMERICGRCIAQGGCSQMGICFPDGCRATGDIHVRNGLEPSVSSYGWGQPFSGYEPEPSSSSYEPEASSSSYGSEVSSSSDTPGGSTRNHIPGEPVRSRASGEPVRSQASGEPVRSQAPGEPVRSQAPGEPVRSQAPGEPVRSRASGEPVRSQAPGEAVRSQAPGEPVRSHASREPVRSRAPGQPVRCHTPGEPVRSQAPGEPVRSRAPGQPVRCHTPGEPARSHVSGQPVGSYAPEQPAGSYGPDPSAGSYASGQPDNRYASGCSQTSSIRESAGIPGRLEVSCVPFVWGSSCFAGERYPGSCSNRPEYGYENRKNRKRKQ